MNDASLFSTKVRARNQGDKAVQCTYLNIRGFNNDPNNSTGGWELKDSDREPDSSCYVHGGAFDYTSRYIYVGGQFQSGQWQCAIYTCYATTRHHFEQTSPAGLREFYTSNDGAHSAPSCWSAPPGC